MFLTVLTLSAKYQNGLAVGKPTALFVAEHRRGNYLPLFSVQLLPFAWWWVQILQEFPLNSEVLRTLFTKRGKTSDFKCLITPLSSKGESCSWKLGLSWDPLMKQSLTAEEIWGAQTCHYWCWDFASSSWKSECMEGLVLRFLPRHQLRDTCH